MGFKLSVEGSDKIKLGVDVIRSVHVEVGTPSDSRAKSTDVAATMWVTGKIISTESTGTLKLFDWSLVPAQSSDAYRNVIVEVIANDLVVRRIPFSNAFVIDYNERFIDSTGVGEFALVLRQKADQLHQVKPTGGLALEDSALS
ncbi:hypothetical protein Ga0466249_002415 [Sporomusaceae bacterium BoRhaA]|uniref:membrane-associated protease 1 n=1 Tax=Pelorhabdus rhamnosifermentans TaxID=2772457 RepID=UPI001C061119|nr:membrane-associated protease 1 [Pelorhabdus rhamnosifermentans]MBU2701301.1 hypothetical protein [Pelorhabdus rhamnosifermentans]